MQATVRQPQVDSAIKGETLIQLLMTLTIGGLFGIVLVKSEVASWFRIQQMFLFQEAHMYLVIISAVVVGAISLYLLRKFEVKTVENQEIDVKDKPFHKGVIYGGAIFGLGWAITGACPGPIYAQLGSGEYLALITLGFAMIGMYSYAFFQDKLPH